MDFAAALHEKILRRVCSRLLLGPIARQRLIRFEQAMLLSSIATTAERVRVANCWLHTT